MARSFDLAPNDKAQPPRPLAERSLSENQHGPRSVCSDWLCGARPFLPELPPGALRLCTTTASRIAGCGKGRCRRLLGMLRLRNHGRNRLTLREYVIAKP